MATQLDDSNHTEIRNAARVDGNDVAHHPAVRGALEHMLAELRWSHPNVRVCCGVFYSDDVLRFWSSSSPHTMQSLDNTEIDGPSVRAYLNVLGTNHPEFSASDVRTDDRLQGMSPAILGEDTISTHVINLSSGGKIIGFLRVDEARAGVMNPIAIEALDAVVPTAVVAVALERECVSAQATARELKHLSEWMSGHQTRQCEAAHELRSALIALTDETRRLLPKLDGGALRQLNFSASQSIAKMLELIVDDTDRELVAGSLVTRPQS